VGAARALRAAWARLLDGAGDHLADFVVVAGGDGGDSADVVGPADGLCVLSQLLDQEGARLVDALLDANRVGAGGDALQAVPSARERSAA
jgi:hypothetical protein